jgi:hypothetical protein
VHQHRLREQPVERPSLEVLAVRRSHFVRPAAPVTDIQHRLLAVVVSDLPVHQGSVERGFLGVVHDLTREVIESSTVFQPVV